MINPDGQPSSRADQILRHAGRRSRRVGRWDVISDAITDTARTIRLIAILLASSVPPGLVTWLAVRRLETSRPDVELSSGRRFASVCGTSIRPCPLLASMERRCADSKGPGAAPFRPGPAGRLLPLDMLRIAVGNDAASQRQLASVESITACMVPA